MEEPRVIVISTRSVKMYVVLASLLIALSVVFAPSLEQVEEGVKSLIGWNRGLLQDQIEICNKAEMELEESIKGLYGTKQDFSRPRLANEAVRSEIINSGKLEEEGESALDEALLFCSTRPRYRKMVDKIYEKVYPLRSLSI
jgi:hypothetical protein